MASEVVLITGSTEFIGSHVVRATLEAGYRIRLAVRTPTQEAVVKAHYARFSSAIDTAIIPDFSHSDFFVTALRDVKYVFNLALPMPGSGSDVRSDYVDPAVRGTQAILFASMKYPDIEKLVVVSSALALLWVTALIAKAVTVNDKTGEVISVDLDVPLSDDQAGAVVKYSASKILTHQATGDFVEKHEPIDSVVTLHPVFVLGDSLLQQSAEDIGGINALFCSSLFSKKPSFAPTWVNVRDVADAHVRVLQR